MLNAELDWSGCEHPDIPRDVDGKILTHYPISEGLGVIFKIPVWYSRGPIRVRAFVFDLVDPIHAVFREIEELER